MFVLRQDSNHPKCTVSETEKAYIKAGQQPSITILNVVSKTEKACIKVGQ